MCGGSWRGMTFTITGLKKSLVAQWGSMKRGKEGVEQLRGWGRAQSGRKWIGGNGTSLQSINVKGGKVAKLGRRCGMLGCWRAERVMKDVEGLGWGVWWDWVQPWSKPKSDWKGERRDWLMPLTPTWVERWKGEKTDWKGGRRRRSDRKAFCQ